MLNLSAIYHRSTDQYCYPIDSSQVFIQIQTGKEIEKITIVAGDPYDYGIMGGDYKWTGQEIQMTDKLELRHHNMWSIKVQLPYKRLKYYFKIYDGDQYYYVLEEGILTEEQYAVKTLPRAYNFAWLNDADILRMPSWVNQTRWYQIFPERFANGNSDNDPEHVKPWNSQPHPTNRHFYGGDIAGILEKLDYIKDLGFTGIYLTPIFKSPSSHKYDTTDYFQVDPEFGTAEEFKQLVDEAHKRGIKIMIDAVFNHCGDRFSQWLDVLEKGEESEFKEWFMINDYSNLDQPKDTRDGRFYSFAFTENMPKLNTNNPVVQQYLQDVTMYWIDNFGIDGWRLDVANEVSHDFWKKLRSKLDEKYPDFYLLGEVWYDSTNWLRKGQFDSVMNYPLTMSIIDFFENEKQSAKELEYSINNCYTMYPSITNEGLFNLLDSHDTRRLFNVTHNSDRYWQMLALLYAMNGTSCVFYGTEIEMEGAHDPDCRKCMPWDQIENGEFTTSIEKMQQLNATRSNHQALSNGIIKWNESDNRVIAFEKSLNDETIKVILNSGDQAIEVTDCQQVLFANKFTDNKIGANGTLIYK